MELLSTTQKPQEKAHLTATPVHKVFYRHSFIIVLAWDTLREIFQFIMNDA